MNTGGPHRDRALSRKHFNLGAAAAALGISANTLKSWAERGMPVIARGDRFSEWRLDLGAILEWRVSAALAAAGESTDVPLEDARRRRAAALAALAELDLKERLGEVIELSAAQAVLFEGSRALRDTLQEWPGRVAALIAADLKIAAADEVLRVLTEHLRVLLGQLAEPGGGEEFSAAVVGRGA